jgi:Family of unknown function (DUF6920)
MMLSELILGVSVCIVVFSFILVVGHELFAIMIDEQLRYLRLIIHYAPLPAAVSIPQRPEPVSRYVSWALGENRTPSGCMHFRHGGRIRYGKTGRWMGMGGEGFFSAAAPAFVWHATITYAPGVWLEMYDYYVDRKAGMNLNLFSVFPLDNAKTDEIKGSSLFRYLARTPLFPQILGSSPFIRWENVDDSTAKAIITDKDTSVEALVRFGSRGMIDSIEFCDKTNPETGRPVPGHFASRFSSYADVRGCQVPMQITSEIILPDGEYVCAEYAITLVEFDVPGTICQRRSG